MSMDAVFRALADPVRRQLLDRLYARNGQTLSKLREGHDMTRQAVTKHLAALEEANLVVTQWRGREKLHYLNPVPINGIAERWISKFEAPRLNALSTLKRTLEGKAMASGNSSFVYVTYIRTTPDKLWEALTTPEFMKKYWFGIDFETDWKVGSPWKMTYPDGRLMDTGEIVEFNRPRRIVLKWRHEFRPELTAEGYARCVIDLEPQDNAVKLTIAHTIERADSKFIEAVSGGWPKILSNLKSLLETGEILLK